MVDEVVHFLLRPFFGHAVTRLNLTGQFFTASVNDVEFIVGQLAPLLLHLTFELLPVPFDLIPVYGRYSLRKP